MKSDSRSSLGQKALPSRYFVDRQVFAREIKLLRKSWSAIALVDDLRSAVSVQPIQVLGSSLIAVHSEDGGFSVFHNLCRHRGTELCDQSSTGATRLVCPYHGWSYGLDGTLISAPQMVEGDGFSTADHGLIEVESAVWQGILFVRLDNTIAEATLEDSLADSLAALGPQVAPWRPDSLEVVNRTQYQVAANWKILFQNYSECYHCPILHPALNRLTPFRDTDNVFDEGPILGGPMRLSNQEGSMTTTGDRCGPVLPGLSAEHQGLVHYFTVFPNLFLSLHPDYVLVHLLRPTAVDQTTVDCHWLAPPGANPQDFAPAVEFWDTTNQQDWWVCSQMQKGVSSADYLPGPYSNLESLLAAFDRDYLKRMEASGD